MQKFQYFLRIFTLVDAKYILDGGVFIIFYSYQINSLGNQALSMRFNSLTFLYCIGSGQYNLGMVLFTTELSLLMYCSLLGK